MPQSRKCWSKGNFVKWVSAVKEKAVVAYPERDFNPKVNNVLPLGLKVLPVPFLVGTC